MENHVVLNFREKRGLRIVLGVGFKQVWGICTLFYEIYFVFIISFSCVLLKRKKSEEYKRNKKMETIKEKRKKGSIKAKVQKEKKSVVAHFHSYNFLLF